jgi:hypothetical protein
VGALLIVVASAACRYEPVIVEGVLAATDPTTTTTGSTTTGAPAPTTTTTAAPTGTRWRLFAVGDVKIDGDDVARSPFGAVRPALREADVSIVNVEMAIGDPATAGTAATKAYTFLGPTAVPALLAKAGVDVAGLANTTVSTTARPR